ncbi:MAG: IclR family transcriptional regulator [Alphaproteobacteria bacterium]|nr:IclR family transcriptional regulator [Alphaproteobacteria bacterium]
MSDIVPIQSVATSLAILETMADAQGPVGVSELARAVGATKPRIYRHLRTLLDNQYVMQDPQTDKYQLTIKLFHLGQSVAEQIEFLSEARRFMEGLREQVNQTVAIGQIEDHGVRILDILKNRSDIEITSPPGTLFDFHSSAQGKVALAFGPKHLWDSVTNKPLKQWTEKTVTNIKKLKEDVKLVQQQGWAVAPEEALIGINALAAPVFEKSGLLAGTITIVGSIQHIAPVPNPDLVTAVKNVARQVSQRLGAILD